MKNILYLLILLFALSFQSCNEKSDQKNIHINNYNFGINDSDKKIANDILFKIDSTFGKEKAKAILNELYSSFRLDKIENLIDVDNYIISDTIAKKTMAVQNINLNETKSIFFTEKRIIALIDSAKTDPSYNDHDTLGISIFLGKYNPSIRNEINFIYRSRGSNIIPINIKDKNTLVIHPTILLKTTKDKDSLCLLYPHDSIGNQYVKRSNSAALNVGELCPPNCPINSFYYQNDGKKLK